MSDVALKSESCGVFLNQPWKLCIAVGSTLVIFQFIRLYIYTADLFRGFYHLLIKADFPDDIEYKVIFGYCLVFEVAQIVQTLFTIVLLIGLVKNNKSYLRGFLAPAAVCYVIGLIVYLLNLWYFNFHLYLDSYFTVFLFAQEIIIDLMAPVFLILVHRCSRDSKRQLPAEPNLLQDQIEEASLGPS